MNSSKITLAVFAAFLLAACSSTKTSKAPTPAVTVAPTPAKPADGIYAPGNEELTAMKVRNPNITQEHLTEGYVLYAKGACINCHEAKNVYQYGEDQWRHIVDDMAIKANITNTQKAAVYAYILSIKATKPAKG